VCVESLIESEADERGVVSDESAGSEAEGDGSLGVVAEGEARDAEYGAFLLEATGVGEYDSCLGGEAEGVEVGERVGAEQGRLLAEEAFEAGSSGGGAGSGVHWEDEWDSPGELEEELEQRGEYVGVVDVGGAVQGDEAVGALFEAEASVCVAESSLGEVFEEGVDHDVADETELVLGDALAAEVVDAALLGDEEQVGEGVGEEAVDLLGHSAVEAPEPGLDVNDGDLELHGGEGAGDGAVDVAEDDGGGGARVEQVCLVAFEDAPGLCAVWSGADVEVDVGGRDAELVEEDVAEGGVVVLAGVDDAESEAAVLFDGPGDGSKLDEVRPRAGDAVDEWFHLAKASQGAPLSLLPRALGASPARESGGGLNDSRRGFLPCAGGMLFSAPCGPSPESWRVKEFLPSAGRDGALASAERG